MSKNWITIKGFREKASHLLRHNHSISGRKD